MIKQKFYNRLNRSDKSMVLPVLTSLEAESMTNHETSKVDNRVRKKSRGRVEIVANLCKGCLLCLEVCPPNVLKESQDLNKMGYHPVEYLGEGCTGCGICFYICPEPGTIKVYKRIQANEQI
ncbi:MAG: ferredoxin family protein [bacterium]